MDAVEPAEAGAGARRAAAASAPRRSTSTASTSRRTRRSARRFQPVFVARADGRGHDLDPARPQGEVRAAPRRRASPTPALVAAATLSNRYITDRFLPDKAIDLDRRGGRAAAHAGRLQARGTRRARPPHHPAARSSSEALKKETDQASQGPARQARDGARRARGEVCRADRPLAGREGQARRGPEDQGAARAGPHRPRAGPAARATSPAAGELAYGVIPGLEKRAGGRRGAAGDGRHAREEAVTPNDVAAGRRRAGPACRSTRCSRARREKLLADGGEARPSASSARPRRCMRSRPPCAAPAPACRTRTGRSARSCSSARPASARPSSPRRWPSFLFDDEHAMVRIDMSEYMEKHSVARLDRRASRLCRLRGGRRADRSRAAQALSGRAVRRDREGAPRRLQRAAAGARRRPPDRRPGPHGRLHATPSIIMTSNLGARHILAASAEGEDVGRGARTR